MIRAAVLVVVLAAGCSAASNSAARAPSPQPPAPAPVTTDAPADPCAAFATFMADLTTYTPHSDRLLPDAQAVLTAAQAPDVSRRIYNHAADLVAFVGSPQWGASGNAFSPQVQALDRDCG